MSKVTVGRSVRKAYLASINQNTRPARPNEIGVCPLQLHAAWVSAQDAHDSIGDVVDVRQTGQIRFLAREILVPERLGERDAECHGNQSCEFNLS